MHTSIVRTRARNEENNDTTYRTPHINGENTPSSKIANICVGIHLTLYTFVYSKRFRHLHCIGYSPSYIDHITI